MELTKYKRLKNLPMFNTGWVKMGFSDPNGGATRQGWGKFGDHTGEPAFDGSSWNMNGDQINSYGSTLASTIASSIKTSKSPTTADELYLSAPVSQRSKMGIPYLYRGDFSDMAKKAENQISTNMWNGIIQDTMNGINIGSGKFGQGKCGKLPKYFSGTGAAIGGTIGLGVGLLTKGIAADMGRSELRDQIAETRNRRDRENEIAGNTALNTGVYNKYYQDFVDPEYLTLRGGKCGKLPKHSKGVPQGVATWYGRSYTDPQTGWGTRGEKMGITDDNGNVIAYRTLGEDPNAKPNNYDKIRINLDPIHGFILDNKISRYVDKTGDIQGGLALQNMKAAAKDMKISNDGYLSSAKCGKLPKHAGGLPRHTIPTWMQMLQGIGQIAYANNNKPVMRNTYVENEGLESGLRDLASLHESEYPILNEVYDLNAKNIKGIQRSGGLSAGQTALAKLAANMNAMDMLAKLRQQNWYQNNKYKTAFADAKMKYGDLKAGRKAEALRYDAEQFAKDHGAWIGLKDAGWQNLINGAYTNASAASQMDMFKMAYDQYAQKLANDKAEQDAKWEAMAKQSELLAKFLPEYLNRNGQ